MNTLGASLIPEPTTVTTPALPKAGAPTGETVRRALSGMGGVRTRSFVESLQNAESETDPAKRAEKESRAVAQEFVAVALVQPLLEQLRSSNNAWGPFKPGAHEERFGAMLDAEYASRISKASGYGLVDRLARDLRREMPSALNEKA